MDHEADVRQATDSFYSVRLYLAPKNKVDKDFGDFFECFKVYIFGSEARDNDRIQAFLIYYKL